MALKISAQENPSPFLFIYDASGSMWGQMENRTKKEIAAEVLQNTIHQLPDNQKIGLIAYGHRKKGDCTDIEFIANISNSSKSNIVDKVESLNPTGKTPLAQSATLAIRSLKETNSKATIILITDGVETCDGDICKVITQAKSDGIEFKLHIIGFGLKENEKEQLICAAKAGDGRYYDANNTDGLTNVLQEATSKTVDIPADNCSFFAIKNGQPVDAWINAKNITTKKSIDGARTYQDTAFIHLPPGKYEVDIQPLENTKIVATTISVEVKEGQVLHRDVSFDSGTLRISTLNNNQPWDATVKVNPSGTSKLSANSRTYARTRNLELPPGKYDIHLLQLKVKGLSINHTINNVTISPKDTTPISHNFESGSAFIGVQTTNGELIDATIHIYEESTSKNVANSRSYTSEKSNPKQFLLTPGDYTVKIKTLGKHSGKQDSFSMSIKAGETVKKIFTF